MIHCCRAVYAAHPEFSTANPPVPALPKEMHRASKPCIPASSSRTISRTVIAIYILYRRIAVFRTLGTNLDTEGPGLSARIRYMLEPFLTGISIRINTSTPMPPIQWEKLLQNRLTWERASTSDRMEEPVVVKPETISNRASTKEGISPVSTKGTAPNRLRTTQARAAAANPSFR